jgi:flagellar protein FlaG
VIVSVIDAESGEVVRQVPSEEALRIARNLADRGSGVIDARA